MYVVTVTFDILPAHWQEFLPLIAQNARRSVADEPECHQFDVCIDPAIPHRVFLYECYTDRAGFEAHLQTPHFHAFEAAAAGMVADKAVSLLERITP